ncbi:hypothetical protein JMJ35_000906 [Cladonia borealis]|uniref:chitinase n=1 Tax=Cladonia borealis TaxID=184061 RepID=A0AA39R7J9_9LECA|nr:hypothetical protein JMJ35_000906 [Cladonia borealis]
MLFKFFSASALSAIALLTQISTQTSHHGRRSRTYPLGDHKPVALQRRDVTQPEVVQLQSEYSQFKGWMTTFFASANASDPGVATLQVQFTAYDGWITNFFGQAGIASASAASIAPMTSKPPASVKSAPVSSPPPASASSASTSLSSPSGTASPLYANSTGPANVPVAGPTGTGSAGAVATFNAKASTNQAVYYGQTPQTADVALGTICEDPSVDIVVLAFLKTYFGPGGYPVLNLGAACGSDATTEAQAKGATGILNCPEVAGNITICQNKGKKVMLSLGGADGTTVFASEQQAVAFATTVWDIFGGGTSDVGRPFGNNKLDGFDIDTEQKNPAYYTNFTTALRQTFTQDPSKTYYISAAPQCPRPDASIPLDAMQEMDFVWVQFYNNGDCNVGESGFMASLTAWSGDLSAKGAGPQLYIGGPACETCGPHGFLEPTAVAPAIQAVHSTGLKNVGGMMLWDGSEAMLNTNGTGGKTYLQVVKAALT